MNPVDLVSREVLKTERLSRCTVDAIVGGERPAARVLGEGNESFWCDVLTAGDQPLELYPGDCVLVWHSGRDTDRGVVLGRVGASKRPVPADDAQVPDEVVIEATKSLTLRVGDGSITIREDGKILIKGKDLVSHAQRTNRIKGGAVAIN